MSTFVSRVAPPLGTLVALLVSGCSGGSSRSTSSGAALKPDDFTNGGFESGSLTGWTVATKLVPSTGMSTFPPQKYADLGLSSGGSNFTSVVSSTTSGYPVPSGLIAADSLTYPFQGSYATVVNKAGQNRNANVLTQSTTITPADVDPADGLVHIRFAMAPVLDNPAHAPNQQPYFFVQLVDTTTGIQFFQTYNFANQAGVQWSPLSAGNTTILYTNWQAFDIAPGPAGIGIGDTVTATIVAAGCSAGGHWGELYVDQFGTTFPVPNVNVSAPAFTQDSSPLTYTILAKNGGNGVATNVVVTWSTPAMADNSNPPQAVPVPFDSFSAPGATCTTPAAGTPGTVSCNIGSLSPGGSYSFTATVDVPAVTSFAHAAVNPVFVNEGIYGVVTDQTPQVGGGLVQTQVTTSQPVDLEASLTDGVAAVAWGAADTYTFVLTNAGPTAATGISVADSQPAAFAGTTWSCVSNGGACGAANGTGAIATTVDLPVGASATFTVATTVIGGPASATMTYQVTATPPAGMLQSKPLHNVGVDTDAVSSAAALVTLTVNKDPASTGQGRVVSSPVAIDCGAACTSQQGTFAPGALVSVSAIAPPGQTFTGWSGACTGTTNPCNLTLAASTTLTARFEQPTMASSIATTSNGGAVTVRPGDTADYAVTITIPQNNNAAVSVADLFPADLALLTVTPPVPTGNVTCSVAGGCTAPTVTNGATTTLDFGAVSCTTPGGCQLAFTVRGQVTTTATRGDSIVNALSISGGPAQSMPALTVIEPGLTLARSATPTLELVRGQSSTVTVTLSNSTGGANSDAFNVVVAFPTEADTTAGQYVQGTCPLATATFGASAVFTFAAGSPSPFPAASTCSFSYVVTLAATAPYFSTMTIPAGTATSQSIPGSAPPAKSYSTSDSSFTLSTTGLATGQPCTASSDCLAGVCDPGDGLCGNANGAGPCTAANALLMCQSGACSVSLVCEAPGSCLVDGDCQASQYCDTVAGSCTAKLVNGTVIPTLAGHAPPLTGACSPSVAASVCASAACDTNDGKCGVAIGDGTCTSDTQCRSGRCISSGTNAGTCEACASDTDCGGSTPACNTSSNACVACTATNATACTGLAPVCNVTTSACVACVAGSTAACKGTTPVCDVTSSACVACTGDYGTGGPLACPTALAPQCNLTSGACAAVPVDAGIDAGVDASGDAGTDASVDAAVDAAEAGASDASDADTDATADAQSAPDATVVVDSGTVGQVDASSPPDAGVTPRDAGSAPRDAGTAPRDSAAPGMPFDASLNDNPEGLVVEGGGCSQGAGGHSTGDLPWAVTLVLALSVARRRRPRA